MAETMRRSKLGNLTAGSEVNLERAMLMNGRLGGHIVSGHIDGTGKITAVSKEDQAVWLTISAGKPLLRYIVEKGSVAIDGVSLTVAGVESSAFRVSLIPHTGKETVLLRQRVGDTVNLECDVIGKYVENLLGMGSPERALPGGELPHEDRTVQGRFDSGKKEQLTEHFLRENGFY